MIRYTVLLITLLSTWFIVQTFFDRSWKAISLRSWLGEVPAGVQPGPEGGCGQPHCKLDPGAAYSCHEHLHLQSLAKAIATSSDHRGREGTAPWEAAPGRVAPGVLAATGSSFGELVPEQLLLAWERGAALRGV